jgi:hypothetical protein
VGKGGKRGEIVRYWDKIEGFGGGRRQQKTRNLNGTKWQKSHLQKNATKIRATLQNLFKRL